MYYGSVVAGSCVGKRVFGIDVVDTPTSPDIANLDVCGQVGPLAALVKTVSGVQVSDGVLNIQSVYGSVDDPEVAAIEVIPSAAPSAPTVTSTSPANGAGGVVTSVAPTATFSTTMDATTLTSSSFTLTPAGGSPGAATVSYNAATQTAKLSPGAALAK